MYYLNSRFYDPAISRFINADSRISGNGEELLGYNMFTYCFNNPVNLDDSEGNWPRLRNVVRKMVAAVKTVIRHVENFQNKKKIQKRLKQNYSISEAEQEINSILQKYTSEVCTATFHPNSGVNITNSYQVTSRTDRQEVSMIIERTVDESGKSFTERSAGNMAAEWFLHNEAYQATLPFTFNTWFESKNNSAVSAFIDDTRDGRKSIWIGSYILEIWGLE